MIKVYSAYWCPHCRKTESFLNEKGIAFESINIEKQPDDVVQKIVEVNGGVDWVVPTIEFNGKWRPGKVFKPNEVIKDLKAMGVQIED